MGIVEKTGNKGQVVVVLFEYKDFYEFPSSDLQVIGKKDFRSLYLGGGGKAKTSLLW